MAKPNVTRNFVAIAMVATLLFCGSQLYGMQPDINAAFAAKTAAGLEALTHPPADFPGPKAAGTFITFDVRALSKGTYPSKINHGDDHGILQ